MQGRLSRILRASIWRLATYMDSEPISMYISNAMSMRATDGATIWTAWTDQYLFGGTKVRSRFPTGVNCQANISTGMLWEKRRMATPCRWIIRLISIGISGLTGCTCSTQKAQNILHGAIPLSIRLSKTGISKTTVIWLCWASATPLISAQYSAPAREASTMPTTARRSLSDKRRMSW